MPVEVLGAKPDGEGTTENQFRKQITFRLSQSGFPVGAVAREPVCPGVAHLGFLKSSMQS